MSEIQYIGEQLMPGQIGHFLVVVQFTAALLAAVAYALGTQTRHQPDIAFYWNKIGKNAYIVHGLAVFGVIGMIFYLMINQRYEYNYVWEHVSDDLPFRYIFSAFWEGQEGSFLLWMFWHVILGYILLSKAKKWEAPVMSTLSMIQVFIGSMILGIYFGWGEDPMKIGSNPFLLLRDVREAPIFANADYLQLIDGQGLNVLLQNYWMTIHPPTLFLGFASVAIPFCYAIAGLWTGDHRGWLKPVLPWALFCGAILGTGIVMGGAWAYEALSFGGYWAWDPVENMSLVPWLILIAGIHTNLVSKVTGYSIKSTYLYYMLSFVLIVYSTFLTRSGVLGDTSVHAFTEMGLEWQLVSFIGFFLFMGLGLYLYQRKSIPVPPKEEDAGSKEFWMLIGSLVLLFSAILITASTSLPVYNKIREFFEPGYLGGVIEDPIEHYNKYQLWIAIFIGLLSGFSQYLRFKETNWNNHIRKFSTHTGIAVLIAGALTLLAAQWINAKAWQYLLLLFTGIFTVITNLDYLVRMLRGNLKAGGSSLSHIGFGLMIVGIMASGLNKQHISKNVFAQQGLIEGFTEEDYRKNILLLKGIPMFMSGYEVTYMSDTTNFVTRTFHVNYKKMGENGTVEEEFNLYPNVLYDKSFSKIAASNPSTKRYAHKDIFTHIASLPVADMDAEFARKQEDSLDYELYEKIIGDTIYTRKSYGVIEGVTRQPVHPDYEPQEGDIGIQVNLKMQRLDVDTFWQGNPALVLRDGLLYGYPAQINALQMKIKLDEKILDQLFIPEDLLDYTTYTFKRGDQINLNGYEIMFEEFNTNPSHAGYIAKTGDIAVGARMKIRSARPGANEKVYDAQPVYIIRENRPYHLKDVIDDIGLHLRFVQINPQKEEIQVNIAMYQPENPALPIQIAEDVPRSDYIVLEAIEFPGINFFWLGTVLMMLGLLMSMFHRRSQNRQVEVARS